LNIGIYIEYIEYMRDKIETIGITRKTKRKIKILAKKYGYADCTVLEYLLSGKIKLEELDNL